MPEENGKNGKQVGLLEKVKAGIKEDVQSLKTDMPAKAKELRARLHAWRKEAGAQMPIPNPKYCTQFPDVLWQFRKPARPGNVGRDLE